MPSTLSALLYNLTTGDFREDDIILLYFFFSSCKMTSQCKSPIFNYHIMVLSRCLLSSPHAHWQLPRLRAELVTYVVSCGLHSSAGRIHCLSFLAVSNPPLYHSPSHQSSLVIRNVKRLTSVAFPCEDAYCETSEEYFYDSEQSLASEASGDSFHSANEEFFLPYDVKTDVRRFQLLSLKQTVQSCFARLIGGEYARNNAYTEITVQAQVAQRADNSYPTDKSLSSYSENRCFKLWKFRQNTYKDSRI